METEIYFYDAVERDGSTIISISKGVLEWGKQLCEHENSSQFVCDFVELITQHMLVVEDTGLKPSVTGEIAEVVVLPGGKATECVTNRIAAASLEEKLATFVNREPEYYTTVTRKHPNLGHHEEGRQVIRLPLTFLNLKREALREAERREKRLPTEPPRQASPWDDDAGHKNDEEHGSSRAEWHANPNSYMYE